MSILTIKTPKFHFFGLSQKQCKQGLSLFVWFFDCVEALTSFEFENGYWIFKFTSVDNVVEDRLSVYFKKVIPSRS